MKKLESNNAYSYEKRFLSEWFDVYEDDVLIAIVINEEAARQVIYRETKSDKYLTDEDFV